MFDERIRLSYSIALAGLLALFVGVGCGEDETDVQLNAGEEAEQNDENAQHNDDLADYYELRAVSETAVEAEIGSTVDFGVQLLDRAGEPAGDELIVYEEISSPADPDAGPDAFTAFTDDQGLAFNQIQVGQSPGTIAVRASHPEAESPVEFEVEATLTPPGDLQVSADYIEDQLLELTGVEFHVWETRQMECAYIAPYTMPAAPIVDDAQVASHQDDALFEDLRSDLEYTVTATGFGPEDQIAAHGCIDGIDIESDGLVEAIVPLRLLDLFATGTYEALSVWDFTEALAATGPVGEAIADAIGWVSDPAGMAAETMTQMAVDWVCDEYGTLSVECAAAELAQAEGSAEEELKNFLEDALTSIPGVEDLLEVGEELAGIVESPTIESTLTIIDKAVGEGEVSGYDNWRAIIFEWSQGCDSNDPPECSEVRIGLGEDEDFGALQAEWDGRIVDYDQLEIDPHDMILPYGELILYVLEDFVLPELTGNDDTTTLAEAFDDLLCSNLGSTDFWGIEFDEETVEDLCSTVFSVAGMLSESYLEALEYDVGLAISGEGRMIDLESNGRVDVIDPGMFYGEVEGEDGTTAEMEAAFTAERVD